jgi:hypothetical protein
MNCGLCVLVVETQEEALTFTVGFVATVAATKVFMNDLNDVSSGFSCAPDDPAAFLTQEGLERADNIHDLSQSVLDTVSFLSDCTYQFGSNTRCHTTIMLRLIRNCFLLLN